MKARDPTIVDPGKEDLNRRQRCNQERKEKVATTDPRDKGRNEHEDRQPVCKREAQIFVKVERRRTEDAEAGCKDLHDDSE